MIKALIRKEWKKTYIHIYSFILFTIFLLIKVYVDISSKMEHNNTSSVLLNVMEIQGIDVIYYYTAIALFGGFLAIGQYRPEKEDAKIRLHLHLPLDKMFLINFFLFYGIAVITIFTLFFNIAFFLIITHFFTVEIFYAFQSNFIAYFYISIIAYFGIGVLIIHPMLQVKISVILLTMMISNIYIEKTSAFFSGENLYYFFVLICISYYFLFIRSFNLYTQGYTK